MMETLRNFPWIKVAAALSGLGIVFAGYWVYTAYIQPLSVGNESLELDPNAGVVPSPSTSAGSISLPNEFRDRPVEDF